MLQGCARTSSIKVCDFSLIVLRHSPWNCKGAYLLAIFTGIDGMTGTAGRVVITLVVVVVCTVNGGVEKVLGEVDDEQGEVGVERNRTLSGVGKQLG